MTAPVIGFDLDLTLLDTRAGIAAAFRELAARTGVSIDVPLVVGRLGPPLEQELAHWFPPERVPAAAALYRELYPRFAIDPTVPMPGAEAALAAVRARGGAVVVITSKRDDLARRRGAVEPYRVSGLAHHPPAGGDSLRWRGHGLT